MQITRHIRNLFDQYEHEENRLTHSLLHTIVSDKKLFVDFVKFSVGRFPFDRKSKLCVGSQSRFGSESITSKKAAWSSVPDATIYDGDGSTGILIEYKVTAPLKTKQLKAHLKWFNRLGIENPILLLLTTDRESPERVFSTVKRNGHEVYWIPWWKVYQWMDRYKDQNIVKDFRDYMEFLESRIINRNLNWEGMLTMFNGIPFGEGEPYSYGTAKWTLKSLMDELRKHKKLKKIYNIDTTGGRKAITGSWDYIPFAGDSKDNFTKHPHLTISIRPDWTQVQITLPDKAKAKYWNALISGGKENLRKMLLRIHKRLKQGKPRIPGSVKLQVEVLHRHYRHQKDLVKDGEMYFDVDCLSEGRKFDSNVKTFMAWLDALDSVLKNRRKANFQIAIVARCDHIKGSIIAEPRFVDEAVRALEALKPFYDKITKGSFN
jgi:hypothetical protein